MLFVLGQMAALIACGILWRVIKPNGLDADASRLVLTTLVYYLLLPALVIHVLWQAPLGWDSARIALVAASGVLTALWLCWLALRWFGLKSTVLGALVLASAFPNATYLGLPVLQSTFGDWARSVAIQYDLFACTPLLLTLGMVIARAHGEGERENPLWTLLKIPPLWAALIAVALNLGEIPMPQWWDQWLGTLGAGVIPLMLIALGMSLRWDTLHLRTLPLLTPVLIIQLALMPWLAWHLAATLGLQGDLHAAVVLEAAMPSMVLGLVVCDRYRLDTGLYAAAVSVTTLASLFTVPLWHGWVS